MLTVEKALEQANEILEHGNRVNRTIDYFHLFINQVMTDKTNEYYPEYKGHYPKKLTRQLRFWANLFLLACREDKIKVKIKL